MARLIGEKQRAGISCASHAGSSRARNASRDEHQALIIMPAAANIEVMRARGGLGNMLLTAYFDDERQ